MNYDGWIVIGTDIDSKEFDKEMKRLQRESDKLSKEEEKMLTKKAKLEIDITKATNNLDNVDKKIELIDKKMKNMEEYNLPQNLENNEAYQKLNLQVDSLISKSQEYGGKLEMQKSSLNEINQKLTENASNQSIINNKLEEMEVKSYGLHANFDNIGNSIKETVKKVAKWTLAIFSVRSAYMAVRSAMSTLSQYNEDLANKIESIKVAFATVLEPVITRIVDWVYKLIGYINILTKAWFGIDLFAHSQEKSLKNSVGQAKELNKQMAGWDEATVLNENGTTGIGGATSGGTFEPPELDEGLVKKFERFAEIMKDNWWWIEKVGIALGIVFGAAKIGGLIANISKLMGAKGIGGLTKALGGIPTLIKIGIIVAGAAYVYSTIQKVKKERGELKQDLDKIRDKAEDIYKENLSGETDINKLIAEQERMRQNIVDSVGESYKILHNILGLDEEDLKNARLSAEQSKVTLDILMEQYDTKNLTREEEEKILNSLIDQYNYNLWLAKILEAQGYDTTKLKDITQEYGEKIGLVADGLGLSQDKLNGMIKKSSEEKGITKGIYDDIKDINNTKLNDKNAVYTIVTKADTTSAVQSIANIAKNVQDTVWSVLKGTGYAKGGITYGYAKGGIAYPRLQYFANGGIINQPGRGVPLTQAIGGEKGQEGILPLTDSQQMDLLGQAIARHMNINLTNINQMNGRTISRELKKIKAQQDFATNG